MHEFARLDDWLLNLEEAVGGKDTSKPQIELWLKEDYSVPEERPPLHFLVKHIRTIYYA